MGAEKQFITIKSFKLQQKSFSFRTIKYKKAFASATQSKNLHNKKNNGARIQKK